MSRVTLETVGRRVYFVNSPFAAKDRIKSAGAKWDPDRRQWWLGSAKMSEAEALAAELNGASPEAQAAGRGFGFRPDTPAGVVADKLEESGREDEARAVRATGEAAASRPREDPANIRLTGKATYKGRTYYAGSQTRDGTRVRLLTLPDVNGDFLDFWADLSQVAYAKRYQPREVWDGRRYSGRTRTEHTTLGGIARFVEKQRRAEAAGEPACAACGKRGRLIHDLEDGLMKCPGCADIPGE